MFDSRFAIVIVGLVCACGSGAPDSQSLPAPTSGASPGPAASLAKPQPPSATPEDARARRDKIAAVIGNVTVLKNNSFTEYRDVLNKVEKIDGVVAAEPFIFDEIQIASAAGPPFGVSLKGVDPDRVAGVLDLGAHLKVGSLQDIGRGDPPAIMLGDTLAGMLRVRAGDRVVLTARAADSQPAGPPREYPFRVTGIFHTAIDEFDTSLTVAALASAQQVIYRRDQVLGIELKVTDIEQSDKVARAVERALGGLPYEVMDWRELSRGSSGERKP